MAPIFLFTINDNMTTGFFKKAAALALLMNLFLWAKTHSKSSDIRSNPSDCFIYYKNVTPDEKLVIEAKNKILLEGLKIYRIHGIDKYLNSTKYL